MITLKGLGEFLGSEDYAIDGRDHHEIWCVITALRGPDVYFQSGELGFGHNDLKEATTAVIRHKLGINAHNRYGVAAWPDNQISVGIRRKFDAHFDCGDRGIWHFIEHAKAAFLALGLKWDKLNE